MKKIIIIILLGVTAYIPLIAQNIKTTSPPDKRKAASFAIITDSETYRRAEAEILAYRDALQADGLATWIVRGDWKDPMEVRKELANLHKKSKGLEGVVFVGDIPVALVRNAQHMTTAFKMDEAKYPFEESSVASDRFYDDLALEFEFIRRDSLNPLHFYYKLSEYGPQRLNPTFYSGRIMYPSELGGDKYEEIAKYLRKVVRERRRAGQLDHLVTYAGGGYNSDDLTVWIDETTLIGEAFPLVGKEANSLRRLNFRMKENMKGGLLEQLQRPELDMMIFNEHGSVDKLHITGNDGPKNDRERLDALRSALLFRSGYAWTRDSVKRRQIIDELSQEFGLLPAFFDPQAEDDVPSDLPDGDRRIKGMEHEIVLEDLKGFNTMPRFVIFNACYNGSFHQPGNIASYFIFNDGNTMVTQGNTVNVLQDRWTFEMIGLLSLGVRAGQYNRVVATLEGHIVGDPAFRFAPVLPNMLSSYLGSGQKASYWRGLLDSPYADMRSAALRELVRTGNITSDELLGIMEACPFATTRAECLKLICNFRDANMIAAIKLGLYDSYELVRRQAVQFAWQNGSPELLDAACDIFVNYPESQRVVYNLEKVLELAPERDAANALRAAVLASDYPDTEKLNDEMMKMFDRRMRQKGDYISTLKDRQAPMASRISAIRSVRNNIYHEHIPVFLDLLADASQDTELRLNIAEALGWFTHSYRREEIVRGLDAILANEDGMPSEIRDEINQTIRRLR